MRNVFFIVSREVEPRQHRTIRSNSIECHYIAGESQTWRKLEIFHLKHNSKETWKIGEKNRRLVKYVDEKWNIIIGDKYRLNQKCIIRSYRKLISDWSLLILRIGFIHLVTSLFFFGVLLFSLDYYSLKVSHLIFLHLTHSKRTA